MRGRNCGGSSGDGLLVLLVLLVLFYKIMPFIGLWILIFGDAERKDLGMGMIIVGIVLYVLLEVF